MGVFLENSDKWEATLECDGQVKFFRDGVSEQIGLAELKVVIS